MVSPRKSENGCERLLSSIYQPYVSLAPALWSHIHNNLLPQYNNSRKLFIQLYLHPAANLAQYIQSFACSDKLTHSRIGSERKRARNKRSAGHHLLSVCSCHILLHLDSIAGQQYDKINPSSVYQPQAGDFYLTLALPHCSSAGASAFPRKSTTFTSLPSFKAAAALNLSLVLRNCVAVDSDSSTVDWLEITLTPSQFYSGLCILSPKGFRLENLLVVQGSSDGDIIRWPMEKLYKFGSSKCGSGNYWPGTNNIMPHCLNSTSSIPSPNGKCQQNGSRNLADDCVSLMTPIPKLIDVTRSSSFSLPSNAFISSNSEHASSSKLATTNDISASIRNEVVSSSSVVGTATKFILPKDIHQVVAAKLLQQNLVTFPVRIPKGKFCNCGLIEIDLSACAYNGKLDRYNALQLTQLIAYLYNAYTKLWSEDRGGSGSVSHSGSTVGQGGGSSVQLIIILILDPSLSTPNSLVSPDDPSAHQTLQQHSLSKWMSAIDQFKDRVSKSVKAVFTVAPVSGIARIGSKTEETLESTTVSEEGDGGEPQTAEVAVGRDEAALNPSETTVDDDQESSQYENIILINASYMEGEDGDDIKESEERRTSRASSLMPTTGASSSRHQFVEDMGGREVLTPKVGGTRRPHGPEWLAFRQNLDVVLGSCRTVGEAYVDLYKDLLRCKLTADEYWTVGVDELENWSQNLHTKHEAILGSPSLRIVREEGTQRLDILLNHYPQFLENECYKKAVTKANGLHEEIVSMMGKTPTKVANRCFVLETFISFLHFLKDADECLEWMEEVAIPTIERFEKEKTVSLMRLRLQERQLESFIQTAKQRFEVTEQLIVDHAHISEFPVTVTRLVLSSKTCGRLLGSDAPVASTSPKPFVWLDKSGSSCWGGGEATPRFSDVERKGGKTSRKNASFEAESGMKRDLPNATNPKYDQQKQESSKDETGSVRNDGQSSSSNRLSNSSTPLCQSQMDEIKKKYDQLIDSVETTSQRLYATRDRLADSLVAHHMLEKVYDWVLHNAKSSSQVELFLASFERSNMTSMKKEADSAAGGVVGSPMRGATGTVKPSGTPTSLQSNSSPQNSFGNTHPSIIKSSVQQELKSYPSYDLEQLPAIAERLKDQKIKDQVDTLKSRCEVSLAKLNDQAEKLDVLINSLPPADAVEGGEADGNGTKGNRPDKSTVENEARHPFKALHSTDEAVYETPNTSKADFLHSDQSQMYLTPDGDQLSDMFAPVTSPDAYFGVQPAMESHFARRRSFAGSRMSSLNDMKDVYGRTSIGTPGNAMFGSANLNGQQYSPGLITKDLTSQIVSYLGENTLRKRLSDSRGLWAGGGVESGTDGAGGSGSICGSSSSADRLSLPTSASATSGSTVANLPASQLLMKHVRPGSARYSSQSSSSNPHHHFPHYGHQPLNSSMYKRPFRKLLKRSSTACDTSVPPVQPPPVPSQTCCATPSFQLKSMDHHGGQLSSIMAALTTTESNRPSTSKTDSGSPSNNCSETSHISSHLRPHSTTTNSNSLQSLTSIGEESVGSGGNGSGTTGTGTSQSSTHSNPHNSLMLNGVGAEGEGGNSNNRMVTNAEIPVEFRLDSPLPHASPNQRIQHLIISELIETEFSYVRSLHYVIQHYVPEMQRDDLPQELRGQRYSIFGNIEKIYDFHVLQFLPQLQHHLENDKDSLCSEVAKCFLNNSRGFHLYALYNKNKPKSDQLMTEIGTTFFRTKQLILGDAMDLSSYLLKPVQRMGKLALLLAQLVKACPLDDQEAVKQLRKAEEMITFQLRQGNHLLAMDLIRGCDLNLKEQGELLRQEEFEVWNRNSGYKPIRSKSIRRIFLFENLMLLAKPHRSTNSAAHSYHSPAGQLDDFYQYKTSIKMIDVGLTQNVKDSDRKFEIWIRRRTSKHSYILQAASPTIKDEWVHDISTLLWRQAVRNKEMHMVEKSAMGMSDKMCLDLKVTEDRIQDRAVHNNKYYSGRKASTMSEGGGKRNSQQNGVGGNGNGVVDKRPHSLISVSTSVSSNTTSSSSNSSSFFPSIPPIQNQLPPSSLTSNTIHPLQECVEHEESGVDEVDNGTVEINQECNGDDIDQDCHCTSQVDPSATNSCAISIAPNTGDTSINSDIIQTESSPVKI